MEDTLMAQRGRATMPVFVRATYYTVERVAIGFTCLAALIKVAQSSGLF